MRTPLLALTLSLLPGLARAHDFWVERTDGGYVLRYGHRGGEVLPIDAAKVKAIRCVEAGAGPRDLRGAAVFGATEVRITGSCGAISVLNDGGFWSLTPDGERNLPRTRVPDAVRSWASREYAKWVDPRSPAAAAPVGDELEIVPPAGLARAKVGDKIAVRILFQGKPARGAVLTVDDRPIGESDGAGVVRIRLKKAGVQSLETSVRRPLASPEAESLVLEASLTFEVPR